MNAPRRLILMRHAKSAWDTFDPDHARPLSPRGRRDAPLIGGRLHELGWVPDLVLLSDSRRTTETWQRMARFLPSEPVTLPRSALYLSGFGAVQRELAAIPEHARTVLALGHNPDWERALAFWAGRPERMTTANAALIELPELPWAQIAQTPSIGHLLTVLRPRELRGDSP